VSNPVEAWALTLLDATTDVIQIFDQDGRYAFINDAGRRLFASHGIDADAMIGRTVFEDVFAESAASAPAAALRRALVDRVASESIQHYPPWGLWFRAHYYPIANGAAAVVVQDITARKLAEDKLSESQAQLKVITDSVPSLISYVDRDLVYRFVNGAYTEWFGLAADAILGRTMQEVLGEQAWAVVGPRMRAALAGDTVEFEAEAPYARGGVRWISASYTPHRHPAAGVIGVVVMVADITARRHAEDALRDADRRKDEFLAILAHELRNPLAPIRTGLELLKLGSDKPDVVARVRPMLERQVSHMVRLIDDLLDVSRITSGKIELQRHHTPLSELVASAVDANAAALEAGGIELTVALPEPPCLLDVDPTRFVQVLSNVLHNAAKYTPRGGRVWIEGRCDDDRAARALELSIRDNGAGIPADLLPRVFDLFVQGQDPQAAKSGLGIGLALARQLVELHGGRIEAHSEGRGLGSTFTVRMPVAAAIAPAEPELKAFAPPATRGRGGSVVIADDNVDAAEMLAAFVSIKGWTPHVAHDGAAAVRLGVEVRPTVILLDIGMPGVDGYEACRQLRANPNSARAFIVALTGWGQDQDKERARQSGFDAHLTKPADLDIVEQLLARAAQAR
jgi:PAS domain S-box-containing protein